MQFEEFEIQVKDSLTNIYDFASLETHPLAVFFSTFQSGYESAKGEFLRKLLIETIESLNPGEKTYDVNATAWRIYIILAKRYVEGLPSLEVANILSMSERQYRRYLKKGVQSVAFILWDRFVQKKQRDGAENLAEGTGASFNVNREEIELADVIQGVNHVLAKRFVDEDVRVDIETLLSPALVESDRIILRQILIEIVNKLLANDVREIKFQISTIDGSTVLKLVVPHWYLSNLPIEPGNQEGENNIWFWSEKLNLNIEQSQLPAQQLEITIRFIKTDQKKILIVDDQEPAIKLFTRYLSRSNVKVIGLSKPAKAVVRTKEIMPQLIILDIMMPKIDGWEILQSLKLDEQTRQIPVIVCSAWGEPELAKSLGAVEFLRKPVTQRDLLATIQAIGVLS